MRDRRWMGVGLVGLGLLGCRGGVILGDTAGSTAASTATSSSSSGGGQGGATTTASSTGTGPDAGCLSSGCVPMTCAEQNVSWGPVPDGCGGVLECGSCTCYAQGIPPTCCGAVTNPPLVYLNLDCCGVAMCVPSTCAQLGIACGRAPDNCGGVLECGKCLPDGTCAGGGQAGDCSPCVPKTCASAGYNCGTMGDGCGGTLSCGTCDPCVPCNQGVCAGVLVSMCTPKTCADLGYECGEWADGCCGVVQCGTCAPGLTCSQGRCLPMCSGG